MASIVDPPTDGKTLPSPECEHSIDLTPGHVWSESQLAVLRSLLAPLYKAKAAVERCERLADELDAISDEHYAAYKHGDPSDTRRGSAYTEGFCVGYDSAAQRLRAALRGDA